MQIAHAPAITLIIAAAMGLLNVWLGVRVMRLRYSKRVSLGHGDVPILEARIRAHGNLVEYAPIALILMLVIELVSGPSPYLWAIGAALVIGRVLHPFGLERKAPNIFRALGMGLTWIPLVLLAGWAILIAYGVVR